MDHNLYWHCCIPEEMGLLRKFLKYNIIFKMFYIFITQSSVF